MIQQSKLFAVQIALCQMMMKNAITASKNANCTDFGENSIISIFHHSKHQSSLSETSLQEDKDENTDANNNSMEEAEESLMFEHLDRGVHSDFISNILFYIGGFIVLKLVKKLTCQACKDCLVGSINRAESDHDYCGHLHTMKFSLLLHSRYLSTTVDCVYHPSPFLIPLNSVNTSLNSMCAKMESTTPNI